MMKMKFSTFKVVWSLFKVCLTYICFPSRKWFRCFKDWKLHQVKMAEALQKVAFIFLMFLHIDIEFYLEFFRSFHIMAQYNYFNLNCSNCRLQKCFEIEVFPSAISFLYRKLNWHLIVALDVQRKRKLSAKRRLNKYFPISLWSL